VRAHVRERQSEEERERARAHTRQRARVRKRESARERKRRRERESTHNDWRVAIGQLLVVHVCVRECVCACVCVFVRACAFVCTSVRVCAWERGQRVRGSKEGENEMWGERKSSIVRKRKKKYIRKKNLATHEIHIIYISLFGFKHTPTRPKPPPQTSATTRAFRVLLPHNRDAHV